jgi:hypothetical protein
MGVAFEKKKPMAFWTMLYGDWMFGDKVARQLYC